MASLLRRIVVEKRVLVLPLALALVANILAYALLVRPLALKSAGAADRADVAASARRSAEKEEALARELVTGKARADEELSAFYQKVLPADQGAARRMTYASLPALARKTNIRFEERRFSIEDDRADKAGRPEGSAGAQIGRLVIRMVLQGEYENLRTFIYELESAPQFLIIDDVTLLQATGDEPLTLTIDLSTYFHQTPHGL
jgi:hypothetical protein